MSALRIIRPQPFKNLWESHHVLKVHWENISPLPLQLLWVFGVELSWLPPQPCCGRPTILAAYPRRVESRVGVRGTGLPGEKGTSYFCPFPDRRCKSSLTRCSLKSHSHQLPMRQEGDGCAAPEPRLLGVGEKELTLEAQEALALKFLNPGYTLESLGEHLKLNTNTLAPTFKRS